MNEVFPITAQKRLGIALMLAACYGILGYLVFRLDPASRFSAYMPMDLWVVDRSEVVAARAWTAGIFAICIAVGIIAFVRTSVGLAAVIPLAMAASIPFGLLRFGWGMRAFN